jgi:hypothetical protein
MKTFLCGVLLMGSSWAFAGNGGMVGGGKRPPGLKGGLPALQISLDVPDLNISLDVKIYHYGTYNVVAIPSGAWELLQDAAFRGLSVEAHGASGTFTRLRPELVDDDIVVLKDDKGIATYAFGALASDECAEP